MRALILGGNGLLGSALTDELVGLGHEVTVFDRFSTPPAYRAGSVRAVAGDFLDTEAVAAALVGQETLFHLVSASTPASADDDPVTDVRANVAQSVEVLRLAVAAGVGRVHFASTGGAMYGEVADGGAKETDAPAPVSPYAIGKLAVEGYLRYFAVKHGLASIAYRISNPYGPRQHAGRAQGVIPIFLERIAAGRPLVVLGDGGAVRDYVHVDDVARMIAATVGRPAAHPLYNVGSGVGTTLSEVLALCAEAIGREPVVERRPEPPTFVRRSVLDVSRFTTEFGIGPIVPLQSGIAETWAEMGA